MSNITNDTSLESSYPFLLQINNKFAKNIYLILQNPVIRLKCLQKKCPEIDKLDFFKNPWPCHFKYAKKIERFSLA